MVQNPSCEANWFEVGQEIPCISRNPKVRYRTHKRSLPVFILGQPNPVHIPISHLLGIHPNIIHPSTPRSPQQLGTLISQIYFGIKLYVFRTFPRSMIGSFSLYTQQWYMLY